MSVTEHDVRHVASLARLGVADERMPALVAELNGILAHMDVLQRVNVPATFTQAAAVNGMPLRADVADAVPLTRTRDEFAPAMRDGFFLVPRLDTHEATPTGGTPPTAINRAEESR